MQRKLLAGAVVATIETVTFVWLKPTMPVMLAFLLVGGLILLWTWEGLPSWLAKHQEQDDKPTSLGDIRPRTWEEGDPIPITPDFPIAVRMDREPTLTTYSAIVENLPQHRSSLYSILHGLTLTNVSAENVVAFLELIIQRPNGRLVDVVAEVGDPPPKAGSNGEPVPLTEKPAGAQFRRVVPITARTSVVGFALFRLTERALDGRFGTVEPFRTLEALSRDELIELGKVLSKQTALRVTNQLDGSYRDFPTIGNSASAARQFLDSRQSRT